MKEVTNYTYEDLVKIGEVALFNKELPESAYGLTIKEWPYNQPTLLVQREGEMVWVQLGEATDKEKDTFRALKAGLTTLAIQLARRNDITTSKAWVNSPMGESWGFAVSFNTNKVNGEHDVARDVWGLDLALPLTSTAALFYLLYTRHLRGDTNATKELDYLIARILPQLVSYLDMTAGGEARHIQRKNMTYKENASITAIAKEAFDSGKVVLYDNTLHLTTGNKYATESYQTRERHEAWARWKDLRNEFGIIALDWCIMQHLSSSDNGYGGPLWANAALLVRKLELGEVSPVFFIDQAFSLEHNGGALFNKLWAVDHLSTVLDIAFKGDVTKLERHLNIDHRAIYKKIGVGATMFDMTPNQYGVLDTKTKRINTFRQSTVLGLKPDVQLEVK